MPIGGCLSGFCKFVSEFMRLILFFASLVFMLVSVFLFAKSFQGKYTFNTLDISAVDLCFIAILGLSIYLISLSVLGIHATFFRQGTSMEWFSLLAGMNVLLVLAIYMYTSPRLNDSLIQIDHKLKDLQPKYDWAVDLEYDYGDKIDATQKWNIIQLTHHCCGVQSPADWLPFRPKNSSGEFPVSCCFAMDQDNLCVKENIWTQGCVSQIKEANRGVSLLLSALIFMNLLLSIVSNLVICCQPKHGYLAF